MEQQSPSSAGKMQHLTFSQSDMISYPSYSAAFFPPTTSDGYSTNTISSTNAAHITISAAAAAAAAASPATTLTSDGNIRTQVTRLMSDHKDLLTRYSVCLSQLQKTFKEAETLRQENTNLRVAFRDLSDRFNLFVQTQSHPAAPPPPTTSYYGLALSSVVDMLENLSTGDNEKNNKESVGGGWDEGVSKESPTSVIEKSDGDESSNADRVGLPKSISVRSSGFLKASQAATAAVAGPSSSNNANPIRGPTRTRALTPAIGPQKVYVRGGSKKDGPIELEVYNQGMFKTELCNKWQETGACPYSDNCQFAHGIGELRPVLRHPRYKTEVCRMVLSGDPCPYGHRCHFRHALSDQERLMLPLKLD